MQSREEELAQQAHRQQSQYNDLRTWALELEEWRRHLELSSS